jgi:hypothetical protein
MVLSPKSPRLPEDLLIAQSLMGQVASSTTGLTHDEITRLSNREWQRAKLIAAYGIQNAEAIVLAQAATSDRPSLAQCLATVENESGGANVFGGEGTACPQEWWEHEVNQYRYVEYREARDRGGTPDGVGPTQITDNPLQIEAQRLGGCWHPQFSCDVGFHFSHALMVEYGTAGGYMHFNGSGPAAEAYRDRALRWEEIWDARLKAHGLS